MKKGKPEIPHIIQAQPGSDAAAWAAAHRAEVEELLLLHGAILLRGFEVYSTGAFDALGRSISRHFEPFEEESSPRSTVEGLVQTSTDYPSEYPIQLHNEYSYAGKWPMRIYFWCDWPALRGGETCIADTRRVLRQIRPEVVNRFRETGVLYRRAYRTHFGVSWKKAFQTEDKAVAEQRCRDLGMRATWKGSDALSTSQLGDAVVSHPTTGEEIWFNHGFFFNVHALEPVEVRDVMLNLPDEDLSTNTYYGTGQPIEPEIIEELRRAYEAEAVPVRWKRGDVLLIDNMLCAHSRAPYEGERRVRVIMADPFRRGGALRP